MPQIDKLVGFDPSSDTYTFQLKNDLDGLLYPFESTSNVDFVPYTQETINLPELVADSRYRRPPAKGLPFSEVKKSGLIKMTDHEAWYTTLSTHIVRLPFEFAKLVVPYSYIQNFSVPSLKQGIWQARKFHMQGTLDSIDEIINASWDPAYNLPHSNDPLDDIDDAVHEVKRVVVADAHQTWDALTSAAELPKALKLFTKLLKGAVSPVRSFAKLLKDSRNPRNLANNWLAYRYGIMPTILEIQDVMRVIVERGFAYKTSRSSRFGTWKQDPPPASVTGPLKYTERWDNWRVNAVGKTRYSTSSLRALDQISVNPLLTGWELVPFSFVVDWFINVGDFIQARTLDLVDHATQRSFCVSIKRDLGWRQYYRRQYTASIASPQYDTVGNAYYWLNPLSDHSDHLIKDWRHEGYSRRVFHPSDAVLRFKPNLNWSRFLDSIALTNRSTISSMRKLTRI